MRKLLALLLVIAIATSAFAFANSFALNAQLNQAGQQNIASGSASISRCTGNVEIDIVGGGYNSTLRDFEVATVKLNAGSQCAGDHVTVTLTRGGEELATVDGYRLNENGDAEVDFSELDVPVSEVEDVHLLLEADSPTASSVGP